MIDLEIKEKCTGCSTCYNVCPKKCISMDENDEGFLYPVVDQKECIKCKMCIKKCPVLSLERNEESIEEFYVAYSKNEETRNKSSSGGCFREMAEVILNNNGVVFGAIFDNDFNVIHKYVENVSELEKLQGSKYVQSDITKTFNEVKNFLDKDRQVLFSGTPCQIAGIKKFLGKEYKNLYLISIICHGVPSRRVFQKYLKKYKKKGQIRDICFRDKSFGWEKFSMKVELKNGDKYIIPKNEDSFMKGYLSNIYLRKSCYDCQFRDTNDIADISIGDLWGIDHMKQEMNDHKGASLLIVKTIKGKKLIESCKNNIIIEGELKKEELVKYNPCIIKSVQRTKQREKFFKELNSKKDFDELVNENIPRDNILLRILKRIYITMRGRKK